MIKSIVVVLAILVPAAACKKKEAAPHAPAAPAPTFAQKGNDPPLHLDPNNAVAIASKSKDHSTLVAALKAADYVTAVANAGPLTVFAPTNAAFDKLPKGTVETLVKPENQEKLQEILKYHVTTSVYTADDLKDGQTLGMSNGDHAKIGLRGGKISINGANVTASIRASNGIVHVIDTVLQPPPAKK